MGLNLNEHERAFPIKPVGIKYVCEFCNEGEMRVDPNGDQCVLMTNPSMIPHKCTKCGKTMHLTKSYPYIEWVPDEEGSTDGTT